MKNIAIAIASAAMAVHADGLLTDILTGETLARADLKSPRYGFELGRTGYETMNPNCEFRVVKEGDTLFALNGWVLHSGADYHLASAMIGDAQPRLTVRRAGSTNGEIESVSHTTKPSRTPRGKDDWPMRIAISWPSGETEELLGIALGSTVARTHELLPISICNDISRWAQLQVEAPADLKWLATLATQRRELAFERFDSVPAACTGAPIASVQALSKFYEDYARLRKAGVHPLDWTRYTSNLPWFCIACPAPLLSTNALAYGKPRTDDPVLDEILGAFASGTAHDDVADRATAYGFSIQRSGTNASLRAKYKRFIKAALASPDNQTAWPYRWVEFGTAPLNKEMEAKPDPAAPDYDLDLFAYALYRDYTARDAEAPVRAIKELHARSPWMAWAFLRKIHERDHYKNSYRSLRSISPKPLPVDHAAIELFFAGAAAQSPFWHDLLGAAPESISKISWFATNGRPAFDLIWLVSRTCPEQIYFTLQRTGRITQNPADPPLEKPKPPTVDL